MLCPALFIQEWLMHASLMQNLKAKRDAQCMLYMQVAATHVADEEVVFHPRP